MKSLLKFPNELLLQVSSDLSARDLNALLRTNKFFSRLLTTPLQTLAAQDVLGTPALVWAAERGHEPLIRYLLEKAGADINSCDPKFGVTALHKASINGDERVVRLLLDKGAEVDPMEYKMGATPLHWVALYGRRGIARVLLESGADANRVSSISQRTPLQMAILSRHCLEAVGEVVTTLLSYGASTRVRDNTGKTVLHLAIKQAGKWAYHDSQIPRILIDAGAELGVLDNTGWTELHTAALYGSVNIVRLLLESGADIENPNPTTPLHVAIHNGRLEVVRLLLEKGANVDVKNKNGKTPLHEAVLGAPPEMRRLLSKDKVDVMQGGKEEMVRLLLGRKAKVNTPDPKGKTALHYAVSVRDSTTISLLLENDVEANVLIQDSKGRTPLQYAEEKERTLLQYAEEKERMLLQYAEEKRRTPLQYAEEKGRTPLQYVEENGWTSVMKVLMDKESKLKILDSP